MFGEVHARIEQSMEELREGLEARAGDLNIAEAAMVAAAIRKAHDVLNRCALRLQDIATTVREQDERAIAAALRRALE